MGRYLCPLGANPVIIPLGGNPPPSVTDKKRRRLPSFLFPYDSSEFNRTVVIAMAVVRMVQMTVHKIIDVVAMWHGFVTAARAVNVACFMAVAVVIRGADIRIDRANGNAVFIHMPLVRVVQMAVVQVINVAIMFNGGVAAVCAVLMRMVGVMWQGAGIGHIGVPYIFLMKTPPEGGGRAW